MNDKFHNRFSINLDLDEAKRRFINRVKNFIFFDFFYTRFTDAERKKMSLKSASFLGEDYFPNFIFTIFINNDFYRCLQALEAFYRSIDARYGSEKNDFDKLIMLIIKESEIDLGITWESGRFLRTGAKLLDEQLVNENLRWLSDEKFSAILQPFEKGLMHFIEAEKRPELLSDVITDMYEALEALAMIVTGRDNKDLSANVELFIKKTGASQNYKKILKEYISYANDFRHAQGKNKKKPDLSKTEVESFIYLTGIFIRLSVN
ncbi:MAG TPA: hypothetical protein PLO63_13715 [Syntrophales bacterium]|nr:hypothetical protein [Syntrophales bacterium]